VSERSSAARRGGRAANRPRAGRRVSSGYGRPWAGRVVLAAALALSPAAHGFAAEAPPGAPAAAPPDVPAEAPAAAGADAAGDTGGPVVVRLDDRVTRYNLGDHGDYLYRMPSRWDWVLRPIPDMGIYAKETFRLKNTGYILGVVAATAVLMHFDQELVDAVQRGGHKIGIEPNTDNTRTVAHIGIAQLRLPSDPGSIIYFFGDGWTHLGSGATILVWGLAHHDNRAVQTGSQVFEAVLASGGVTQIIKHITGHEDPIQASKSGGRWRFFPDQREYFKRVSKYDAFPSGHLATAMATVTVFAENYPEKHFIRPVGYSMMSLLALQMMNNGVHWASDYPLAIALGYGFGKIAVRRGREEAPKPQGDAAHESLRSRLSPTILTADGGEVAVGVRYAFRR
jgi:PAP2 superfamily